MLRRIWIFVRTSPILREEGGWRNDPDSVLRDLKMKLHLPDPFTSQAFSTEERQDSGLCEFYGTCFQTFAFLSSGEIKDKTLYEIFITLYQSPLNERLLRHCTNE